MVNFLIWVLIKKVRSRKIPFVSWGRHLDPLRMRPLVPIFPVNELLIHPRQHQRIDLGDCFCKTVERIAQDRFLSLGIRALPFPVIRQVSVHHTSVYMASEMNELIGRDHSRLLSNTNYYQKNFSILYKICQLHWLDAFRTLDWTKIKSDLAFLGFIK